MWKWYDHITITNTTIDGTVIPTTTHLNSHGNKYGYEDDEDDKNNDNDSYANDKDDNHDKDAGDDNGRVSEIVISIVVMATERKFIIIIATIKQN